MYLRIHKIEFEAAHYLKGHPKCGVVHGHTYVIRNLRIQGEPDEQGMIVDFGIIKDYIKKYWDHKLLVPVCDAEVWYKTYEQLGLGSPAIVPMTNPTVENIAAAIKGELERLLERRLGVQTKVSFELYEGTRNGVIIT